MNITILQEKPQSNELLEDGLTINDNFETTITKDVEIILYPNQHGGHVFLQNADTNEVIRTIFELPPWITQKALKILERNSNNGTDSSQTLEAETLRRKQEEKINKLFDEIKLTKKEIESIRYDVKTIVSILKTNQNE